jgi:hypothetical protein
MNWMALFEALQLLGIVYVIAQFAKIFQKPDYLPDNGEFFEEATSYHSSWISQPATK